MKEFVMGLQRLFFVGLICVAASVLSSELAFGLGGACTSQGCNQQAAPGCGVGGCKRNGALMCGCAQNPGYKPGVPGTGTPCYCQAS